MRKQRDWTDMWQTEPHHIGCMMRIRYSSQHSLVKLLAGGKVETLNYSLSSARVHTHESLPRSIGQGSYICPHNQVLKQIAEARRSAAAAECTATPTLLLFSRQERSQGQDTRRWQQCPGNGPALTLSRPGKTTELPAKHDHHHTDSSSICFQIQRADHRHVAACALGGPPMKGRGADMNGWRAMVWHKAGGRCMPIKVMKTGFLGTIFMVWLTVGVETPKDPRLRHL